MNSDSKDQKTPETPVNSGDASIARFWTAEERLALRILGRLGYEGDILHPPYSAENKSDHLSLIYDILVEEISAGIIDLGAPGLPLDKTISAAERYYIEHRRANEGGHE